MLNMERISLRDSEEKSFENVDGGMQDAYLYNTPLPLYNPIVGVQTNFRVSYPNHAISRVKCIGIWIKQF